MHAFFLYVSHSLTSIMGLSHWLASLFGMFGRSCGFFNWMKNVSLL
jgi:hypothetical protein